jgi:hypothetical protein
MGYQLRVNELILISVHLATVVVLLPQNKVQMYRCPL